MSERTTEPLPPYVPITEFKYTAPPNEGWTYGQPVASTADGNAWVEGEDEGWTVFNTEQEDPRKLYLLLLSAIVPRPIALVSTVSLEGRENLAPFSWFNQVTPYPPIVSISILHRAHSAKDTLQNILDIKQFTANLISEPWVQQANISAIDTPSDVGEWPMTGLTKAPCVHVRPPRVKESACSFECELLQTVNIKDPATGDITTTLVLGSIKHIHVRNDVLNERGMIDPGKMKPVARMAGVGYARISEGYHIPLPSWSASQDAIRASVPWLEHSSSSNLEGVGYTHISEYKLTTSPNPTWKFGQPVESSPEGQAWLEGEKAGWTVIDTQKDDRRTWMGRRRQLYQFLVSAVVPRPIALVSTISEEGVENLAPISWFNQVSPYPTVISLSISRRDQAAKDTLRNILATKEFTANLISEAWIEQAHAASIDTPPEVSEWEITGLTKAPCLKVRTARVKESACSMECELLQSIDINDPDTGLTKNTLVLGAVKYIHVRNDVLDPASGTIDPGKMKPIARMGAGGYAKITEGYRMARPDVDAALEAVRTGQCGPQ
ncbi:hypothetical protein CVT24_003012 [Panaeolus cyanescens]|uniref:Flavin reductase like domain-containing protein n=1 Tax=Panaeolus cyanescens TaxID=181874 RepID=A0A409VFV1_9AGAR|nr:hypothetical protein CVT24_003012 [Panaeolus cyanescens]